MHYVNLMTRALLTAGLLAVMSLATLAQSPAPASAETQLLQALLQEVRQLRIGMQRAALTTYRVQALSERVGKQQALVERLQEEGQQVRQQMLALQDTSREQEELAELEVAARESSDPAARAQLAQSYAGMKRALERQHKAAQEQAHQLQARQQQLYQALQVEQAKLQELQDQRDALDRDLENQTAVGMR